MQDDFPVGKTRLEVGQARQQAPVRETRKAPDGQRTTRYRAQVGGGSRDRLQGTPDLRMITSAVRG